MKKFELSINRGTSSKIDVAIINNFTNGFASQNLRSMKPIKKKFKHNLSCENSLCFSFMTENQINEMQSMLPNHCI